MSLTYKFILDTRRNRDKVTYPVKLRIYQGASYSEHSLRFQIAPEQWDEDAGRVLPTHLEHHSLNAKIVGKQDAVMSLIKIAELHGNAETPASIVSALNRADGRGTKPTSKTSRQSTSSCMFEYAEVRIRAMQDEGRVGNAIVYSCAVNKLKGFVGKKRLPFSEVTHSLLSRWNTDMIKQELKTNAISNYLRTVRALYNAAVMDGLADQSIAPFARISIKSEKTPSRSLTLEEMRKLANARFQEGSSMELYRRLFILSFLLIGINFADLLTLKTESMIEGRIVFHRKKTGKLYSILIPKPAMKILESFRGMTCKHSPRYLLPFIDPADTPAEQKRNISLVISNANDNMKKVAAHCKISKSITTYYARYAWANIARKDAKCSKDLIAEALGHEYGNKVTGIYLDSYGEEEIDAANRSVSTLVFGDNPGE